MAGGGYALVSYRGLDLNDGVTFRSFFVNPDEGMVFNTFRANIIESDRPYDFPVFVRSQPDGIRFVIEIHLLQTTQAIYDTLKQYFSPEEAPGLLVVATNMGDSPSTQRQILCAVEAISAVEVNVIKIIFRASIGVWESVTPTTVATQEINNSGDTFDIEYEGSARGYPIITLTPKTLPNSNDTWIKKRHIVFANRSPSPLYDFVAGGTPVMVLDLDSISLTNGNDIRVLLNGVDIPRWISSNNKLWINLECAPRRIFTLADAIDDSSLDNIYVESSADLNDWDEAGYFIVDNEAIQYNGKGTNYVVPILRGALNTTAATHSQSTTTYWIQHPTLTLIYEYDFAGAPQEPTDLKPIFNIEDSDNEHWVFKDDFFNNNDLKGGAWRKEYTEDNPNSPYIRAYESSNKMAFENATPITNKVLANNAVLEVPFALSKSVGAVILTETASGTTPLDKEGYSYRRRVVRTDYTYERIDLGEFYTYATGPSSENTGFRKQLQQVSAVETEIENTFPNALGSESEYTSYVAMWTGNYSSAQTVGTSIIYAQQEKQAVAIYTIRTTYTQERGVVDESQTAMDLSIYGVDKDGYEGVLALNTAVAIDIFRVRLNVSIPIGIDLEGNEFTEAPDAIKDGTQAKTFIDDIEIHFDTNQNPKIVVCEEEEMYYMNGALVITNQETNEFAIIALPTIVNNDVEFDVENNLLIDAESGLEISAGLVLSTTKALYCKPGTTNTYSVTMSGINGGDGRIDIDITIKDRWL